MTSTITVCLTIQPPNWALTALASLHQHSYLNIIDAGMDVNLTVDVMLHFGHYDETVWQKHRNARLGFWFFRFAGQDLNITTATRRSVAGNIALESSLWVKYQDGHCDCLYQSFGQNDGFAVWRTVSRTLAKAAYFPERVLSRYLKTGALTAMTPETVNAPSSTLKGLLSEGDAFFSKAMHKIFCHEQWFIAVGHGQDLIPNPKQAKWLLMPPKDFFWADPFPIEYDGRIWLLFEGLEFSKNRGYLAAIELFPDGTHSAEQKIMVRDYHLSYPFLLKWQDQLYMLPEAGESREVALWRCKQFPDQWEKAAILVNDVCFTDATIVRYNGLWWMFLTIGENGICLQDELYIYYAESLFGTWKPHNNNPVKSDARNARPAGNIVVQDDVLYRPAQDCGTGYGKAVVINRIDVLTPEQFSETSIARIETDWYKNNHCTHTLSRSEHYWAVDGLRLLPRWAKK